MKLNAKLRKYQRRGVNVMLKVFDGCALNADDMGLGKTIQSIETVRRHAGKMAVIACPNFLKLNWIDEFKKFLPDEELYVCYSQKPKSLKGFTGTAIINYDILNHWKQEFIKAGVHVFICDESQFLKNNTKRTKAAIKISKAATVKIILTGTPIEKHPADLYWQLQIIRPKLYPNFYKFIKRYNSAVKTARFGWQMGRAVNMKELHKTLTRECMIRRLKSEVLTELPEKVRQVIPIEIDNRKEYQEAEKNIIAWVRDNTNLSITKAKKIEQLTKLDKLKYISALGKLKTFSDWANSESENTKLCIFCSQKRILKELIKVIKNSVVISSDMNGNERKLAEHRFNNDPNVRTMLTTIRVGGTGLNFQKDCATTVFFQTDWNSAKHDQAEDRVYRIGQEASMVRAIYFVAVGTIEESLMQLIDVTRQTAGKAIDGIDVEKDDLLTKLLEEWK